MSARHSKNNLSAGIFVIAAILAAAAITAQLGGIGDMFGKVTYTVRFPIDMSVAGVARGSNVLVQGRNVGTVTGIEYIAKEGEHGSHYVHIRMDRDVVLRATPDADLLVQKPVTNANVPHVLLKAPLLGSRSELDFISLGPVEGEAIASGQTITASVAGGQLAQMLGLDVDSINDIIAQFQSDYAAGDIGNMMLAMGLDTTNLQEAIANLQSLSSNIDVLVADLRSARDERGLLGALLTTEQATRFDNTLANVEGASGALNNHLDPTLVEFRAALSTLRTDYLDAYKVPASEMVEDAAAASEQAAALFRTLNEEYTPVVGEMLEGGRDAVLHARDISEQFRSRVPGVKLMLADLSLASDQLRDTMLEIRRSPWRLLYRPSEQESEYELLYDSARAYAGAVSELQDAATALEELASTSSVTPAGLAQVQQELQASFESYRQAEQHFLDKLLDQPAAKKQ